jgi:hypothetical protein
MLLVVLGLIPFYYQYVITKVNNPDKGYSYYYLSNKQGLFSSF